MPLEVTERARTLQGEALPSTQPRQSWKLQLLCFAVPVACALALALAHNFVWSDIRITLTTDGKHYLMTVQKFVEALLAGRPGDILGAEGAAAHMLLDGPLMALLYVPAFLLGGHVPTPRDWGILAQGQSLLHAGTAGLVSLLVLRCTKNAAWSLLAGLLFAAYPPAVLQTGHFMTETPAALLCVGLVWSLSSLKKQWLGPLLAGLTAGLLIVSKPALIPGVVLACFFGLMQFESKKKAFSGFTITALFVVLSWCGISYEVSGKPSLTAQRQPVYNVSKAWNTEFDGWGCNPHPLSTDLNGDSDGPLNVVYANWYCHPQECLTLTARKVTRMFALPWNDFKNRAVGVDMNGQMFWHQMLLCGGLYGLFYFAFSRYRRMTPSSRLVVELSAILLFGHLGYLLAESTARYAFTAVPLLMVLAMFGLAASGRREPSESPAQFNAMGGIGGVLGCLIAAMVATSLMMHAEKLTKREDPRNLRELCHTLTFGQRAEKVIDFTEVTTPKRVQSLLVLVDGDKNLEQCEVWVNGKRATGHLLPVNNYDAPHYELYNQMREFAPSMGVNAEDFRQWRAVAIDSSLINWHGRNRIEVSVKAPAAIVYGDGNVESRYMLSPDYFSYGLVSSAPIANGAESRCADPVLTGANRQSSRILSGSRAERLFDSLRIRLACVLPPAVAAATPSADAIAGLKKSETVPVATSPFKQPIVSSAFDPMLQEGDQLRMNKTVLYSARSIGASIKLPAAPPSATHMRLTLRGEIKANRNVGNAGVLVALTGTNGQVTSLGRLPRAVHAAAEWSRFEISDVVPVATVGGKVDSLAVALYPVPWMEGQYGASRRDPDVSIKDLTVEGDYTTLPALAGTKVIYY